MNRHFDFISDIHGCAHEMNEILSELGYDHNQNYRHPSGRQLIIVGDITDRGPNSIDVIRITDQMVKGGNALYLPGNHCDKLYRWFLGRPVQVGHGLEKTIQEWEALLPDEQQEVKQKFMHLFEQAPLYQLFDDGNVLASHGGMQEELIGRTDRRARNVVLYGPTKLNANREPERIDWAPSYSGRAFVIYGHTPVWEARLVGRTVNIDTGCSFGNKLTAYRYPEHEFVEVPSTLPLQPDHLNTFSR